MFLRSLFQSWDKIRSWVYKRKNFLKNPMTGTSKGEAYIEYDFSLYMEMVTQYNEKRVFPEMEIPV